MLLFLRRFFFTVFLTATLSLAQQSDPAAIKKGIENLRQNPDAKRGEVTHTLALQIRALPPSAEKVRLADALSHLVTEGDQGQEIIQAVANTLASSLTETPVPQKSDKPMRPYYDLAKLVHYMGVTSDLNDPQFTQSMELLKRNDTDIEKADFTLEGINLKQLGLKEVTLSQLRGKIVLVNFWATWCPPCRHEMPDLQVIYDHYKNQGLVILSITDEESFKVAKFLNQNGYKYPILLDPSRKASGQFHVDGIPQSFVFDREGKLVARSIDMCTQQQFFAMLSKTDLKPE